MSDQASWKMIESNNSGIIARINSPNQFGLLLTAMNPFVDRRWHIQHHTASTLQ